MTEGKLIMLKLNINQEKKITFEVQIGGIHYDQVKSRFSIILGEIEYTFPAKVGRDKITISLPPLNTVVGTNISKNNEALARLDVIADGYYLTPWEGVAILSNPVVVEAKIKNDELLPTLKEKTINNNIKFDKNTSLEEFKEKLTKEDVLRFIGKQGIRDKQMQKLIYEQSRMVAKKDVPVYILKEVHNILKK